MVLISGKSQATAAAIPQRARLNGRHQQARRNQRSSYFSSKIISFSISISTSYSSRVVGFAIWIVCCCIGQTPPVCYFLSKPGVSLLTVFKPRLACSHVGVDEAR